LRAKVFFFFTSCKTSKNFYCLLFEAGIFLITFLILPFMFENNVQTLNSTEEIRKLAKIFVFIAESIHPSLINNGKI